MYFFSKGHFTFNGFNFNTSDSYIFEKWKLFLIKPELSFIYCCIVNLVKS